MTDAIKFAIEVAQEQRRMDARVRYRLRQEKGACTRRPSYSSAIDTLIMQIAYGNPRLWLDDRHALGVIAVLAELYRVPLESVAIDVAHALATDGENDKSRLVADMCRVSL